jgi:signal transduction histidine kinase
VIALFWGYRRRLIVAPLKTAVAGARRLGTGDFGVRLPETGVDEMGELERAFNRMADDLEVLVERLRESERLKSEVVSVVSHELRSPLTSMIGFARLLIVRRALPDPEHRRYLQIVVSEGERLTKLIGDFLDITRLEEHRGDLEHEPVDVAQLLREQVELFQAQSELHSIELELAEGPLVAGIGHDRLSQVVANLLSNAIKYSPAGGTVEVVANRHNGAVRVEVRDSGLGIPEPQQAAVFTKFHRAGRSREISGTGLGLALSREIIEAYDGRIGFTSAQGRGSTFWFELPAAADLTEAAG